MYPDGVVAGIGEGNRAYLKLRVLRRPELNIESPHFGSNFPVVAPGGSSIDGNSIKWARPAGTGSICSKHQAKQGIRRHNILLPSLHLHFYE